MPIRYDQSDVADTDKRGTALRLHSQRSDLLSDVFAGGCPVRQVGKGLQKQPDELGPVVRMESLAAVRLPFAVIAIVNMDG